MDSFYKDNNGNIKPGIVLIWKALVLIALIIIVGLMSGMIHMKKSEQYIGYPLGTPQGFVQAISGGPDLKFSSQLTATDQGSNPDYYNFDVENWGDVNEGLVGTREPPVFWQMNPSISEAELKAMYAMGKAPKQIYNPVHGPAPAPVLPPVPTPVHAAVPVAVHPAAHVAAAVHAGKKEYFDYNNADDSYLNTILGY